MSDLTQFAQSAKSICPVAFNVHNIAAHGESAKFAVFCHAEHDLYKVIVTGDYLSDASNIADMLIRTQQRLDAEEFAELIEQEFPEDINVMSQPQIDRYFD